MGPSRFFYRDTATGAISQKYIYTTLQLDGNAQNIAPTDNTNYKEGFAKRIILVLVASTNNVLIPLNRYEFFNSLIDKIAPNGKTTIDILFESDVYIIFRPGAVQGRYPITKLALWVPKMIFNAEGQRSLLSGFMKPKTWSYLKERVEISPTYAINSWFSPAM